jgi:DNA-binding winged helix-turn-helix (wHTH) protein
MQGKYWLLGLVLSLSMVVFIFWVAPPESQRFDSSRLNIVLREVGHRLLLQAGDSLSRVLPVTKVSNNEYRITFEGPLNFIPDSLVNIVRRSIIHKDYVVSVIECDRQSVIFGFAMLNSEHQEIVPCLGRPQPVNCYTILIQFREKNSLFMPIYLGTCALLLLAATYLYNRRQKRAGHPPQILDVDNRIRIGRYRFDNIDLVLELEGTKTRVSFKEAKLLSIFAKHQNEVVPRKRLQKEVWEDEGVIVTRSLDMFISKLRKKLEGDGQLKIINVHGIGYKLHVPVTAPATS